jgi:hypothetical protein
MPPAWAWVKDARYRGKHQIDGTTFDLWGHHFGGVELEVAVSEHDASRPHYFMRKSPSEHRVYHFIAWATFQPNSTWFNVPDICKNATFDAEIEDNTVGDEMIMPGSGSAHTSTCAVAASQAARIVEEGNGFDAASMLISAFNKAGITTPSSLWSLQAGGSACVGGPQVGDVFFDGLPATSAAVFLDTNAFAECSSVMGGSCGIVAQRDFTGGCRRYC